MRIFDDHEGTTATARFADSRADVHPGVGPAGAVCPDDGVIRMDGCFAVGAQTPTGGDRAVRDAAARGDPCPLAVPAPIHGMFA